MSGRSNRKRRKGSQSQSSKSADNGGGQRTLNVSPAAPASAVEVTVPIPDPSGKQMPHRILLGSLGGVAIALILAAIGAATTDATKIAIWLYVAAVPCACLSSWFLWVALKNSWVRRSAGSLSSAFAAIAIWTVAHYTIRGPMQMSHAEERLFSAVIKTSWITPNFIHITCPDLDEDTCVFANQFIPLFQRAGWKVEGPVVERVKILRPTKAIMIVTFGPPLIHPQNPDEGVYTKVLPWEQPIMTAFKLMGVSPEISTDSTLPESELRLYFGSIPRRSPEFSAMFGLGK